MNLPFAQSAGLKFRGQGFKFSVMPNASQEFYVEIDKCYITTGGQFSSSSETSDVITVETVLKGATPAEDQSLDVFLNKWNIFKGSPVRVETPYFGRLCQPLFIKVTYKNNSNDIVECDLNLFLHLTKEQFNLNDIVTSGG